MSADPWGDDPVDDDTPIIRARWRPKACPRGHTTGVSERGSDRIGFRKFFCSTCRSGSIWYVQVGPGQA